jgi:hypothetical protein
MYTDSPGTAKPWRLVVRMVTPGHCGEERLYQADHSFDDLLAVV